MCLIREKGRKDMDRGRLGPQVGVRLDGRLDGRLGGSLKLERVETRRSGMSKVPGVSPMV